MRVLLEKDNIVKQASSQKTVMNLLIKGFHIVNTEHDDDRTVNEMEAVSDNTANDSGDHAEDDDIQSSGLPDDSTIESTHGTGNDNVTDADKPPATEGNRTKKS